MDGAGISALLPTVGLSGLQSEHDGMVAAARALEAGQRGTPMPSGPRMPSSVSELIPPALRDRLPSAEMIANLVLGMAPGSGDYMAARDAIDATGAGISALGQGDYMRAGARGIDAMTAALGILPMVPYAAGMFAGRGAKTADVVKLATAERMAAAGASPEDIWRSTGWFQGADGKWRFEIDDSAVPITKRLTEKELQSYPTIRDALPHKQLFEAYPGVDKTFLGPEYRSGMLGSYIPDQQVITVSPRDPSDFSGQSGGSQKSTLLHELQHAIQQSEGFAKGGMPSGPYFPGERDRHIQEQLRALREMNANSHLGPFPFPPLTEAELVEMATRNVNHPSGRASFIRRLAGEVEARAVQSRMNLAPHQRAERAPWLDYDVPIDQQIVRGVEP